MKCAVCVPCLNPDPLKIELICKNIQDDWMVVILDSSASSNWATPLVRNRARIWPVPDFDHGGTRNLGVRLSDGVDVLIFMTQDAVPASSLSLGSLTASFADSGIGAAYGRQLPRPSAGPIERHARNFNYPPVSRVKTVHDVEVLGLKTAFMSNSFAAYRREALEGIGGFPDSCIVSEDTYVAAKMLMAGWKVAYCAEAQVYHSHDYSWRQEFQRYFDIGVFHAREPWIREKFGGAEGEGGRFLRSEVKYLTRHAPHLIPSALIRTIVKYLGFRSGLLENYLPLPAKRQMSMQETFWSVKQGGRGCSESRQGSSTV